MRTFLVVAVLVLVAGVAGAQTLALNPTIVEFSPSADHDALNLDGTPIVDHYDLRIYLEGASEPFQAATSLGKPTPVAGRITVTNAALFAAIATGLRYVARVGAVGPTGLEGVSDFSNPFGKLRTTPPASVPAPVIR